MTSSFDRFNGRGRYRFRNGQPLDPHEVLHPENDEEINGLSSEIPETVNELIAMQRTPKPQTDTADKVDKIPKKVQIILEKIEELDTNEAEDKEIALVILQYLEGYHTNVIKSMLEDNQTSRTQLAYWAVDADRLKRCLILLKSVQL